MKNIFILAFAIFICNKPLIAQTTPTYIFSVWDGMSGSSAWGGMSSMDGRCQTIYYPSDLPTMPSGSVTNVWLRCYPPTTISLDSVTLNNVQISLGYTTRSSFYVSGYDTFITGLSPVFTAVTKSFTGMKTRGRWIKFPAANFTYDRTQNLVVEISHGYEIANNFGGFNLMASTKNTAKPRMLVGRKDSIRTLNSGNKLMMDVGFDVTAAGVAGISNIRSIGLFPNPSTDGHFMVTLASTQAIKLLNVAVSDVTGKVVLQKQFVSVGNEFASEIDASSLAKGTYMIVINADAEQITRKLLLQ